MKPSIRLFVLLILSFFSLSNFSQDILFYISGEYKSEKIAIDSIHFKNFTNKTSLKFTALPVQDEYVVNMTTQEIVDPTGIPTIDKGSGFKILRCVPGELVIACNDRELTNGSIEIYNLSGQRIHQAPLNQAANQGSFSVFLGTTSMYFVKVRSDKETKVFKVVGADDRGILSVQIADGFLEERVFLKSETVPNAPDFSVKLGDSLRIMAFKDKLYSTPAFVKASEKNPVIIAFSDAPPDDTATLTDIDLNEYKIVQIGNRWWMAEDLRTTHFANGEEIPDGTGIGDYRDEAEPAYWFAYNDSVKYVPDYGRLYTWYAASDPRNVCPAGWYLPTNAEWDTLETFLGGMELAGGKMKEAGTAHWMSPNEGATNESGFNALPSGSRLYYDGFGFLGTDAHWWSATHSDESNAWYRFTSYFTSSLMKGDPDKRFGFSVRCIKDEGAPGTIPSILTLDASEITDSSAIINWKITSDGGSPVTETGVYIGTEPNPHLTGNKAPAGSGTGEISLKLVNIPHSTCFYYRAYAINSSGESVGNEKNFLTTILTETDSITDIEGNRYRIVKLWDQWWMAEDLKTTHFADGSPIPSVKDGTAWSNLTGPGYCWNNNDSATNAGTYGILYNWYTVETANLCPAGWHVPSDDEWTILTDHLGGEDYAGGRLKEIGTEHWNDPNTGATDEAGFTALPGGTRRDFGTFESIGGRASWWTATEFQSDQNLARRRVIDYNRANVINRIDNKKYGLSVRCVKDTVSQEKESFIKINEETFELSDGLIAYYGNGSSMDGKIHDRELYLLSPDHNMNWETLETSDSGAIVLFDLLNTMEDMDTGSYALSTEALMNTEQDCSKDINDDGVINQDDCINTLPDGAKYVSSENALYHHRINLYELFDSGLEFQSGSVNISRDGDTYTIEFECTGKNGDVITGFYSGTLHYFDYSGNGTMLSFQYEEALNDGYAKLSHLVEQAWLIDGVFCGEYAAPSPGWNNMANRTINSTDTQVSVLYNNAYNLIFTANNLIDSIPFADTTQVEKNRVTAEARAMRAYGYYILASRFGDVPIYPGISFSQIPRSTVAEVADSMIADLSFATSYLPFRNYSETDKTRFDRGSAMALLTKVHFLMENWAAAYDQSLEIMNSGNYMVDDTNKYESLASADNIQAYDSLRNYTFRLTYDKGTVLPVSHYTEQLIMAMECEVQMANLNLAGNLWMMLTGTENDTPTLDDVFDLWMIFMNKEGVTLSTIKRLDKVAETIQVIDYQTVLPIPQWVLDTNPNMTQNPGY
jgi:uncharacterized protein (TIGR02145 family)